MSCRGYSLVENNKHSDYALRRCAPYPGGELSNVYTQLDV